MNTYYKIVIATIIGASIGFAYYFFLGCNSGACAITSKPLNSTVYGAFLGFVWFLPEFWLKQKDNK